METLFCFAECINQEGEWRMPRNLSLQYCALKTWCKYELPCRSGWITATLQDVRPKMLTQEWFPWRTVRISNTTLFECCGIYSRPRHNTWSELFPTAISGKEQGRVKCVHPQLSVLDWFWQCSLFQALSLPRASADTWVPKGTLCSPSSINQQEANVSKPGSAAQSGDPSTL